MEYKKLKELAKSAIMVHIFNHTWYDYNIDKMDDVIELFKDDLKTCAKIYHCLRVQVDSDLRLKLLKLFDQDEEILKDVIIKLTNYCTMMPDENFEVLFHMVYNNHPKLKGELYELMMNRGYKIKLQRIESIKPYLDEIEAGKLMSTIRE